MPDPHRKPAIVPPIIQGFLDYLSFEKRFSAHTLTAYRGDLADFFHFLGASFGEVSLPDISYSMIRTWLASLKDQGASTRSLNRKISSLRSFFKFQMKAGKIQASPMARVIMPKNSKRLPVFVKENDMKRLLSALDSSSEDWDSLNARTIIAFLYASGMRLSEMISLKDRHIDLPRQTVRVLGKGNKERIIPLVPGTVDLIRYYQEQRKKMFGAATDHFLVTPRGKKLYPKYAYNLVNKTLSGIGTLDKKSPHVLRHSFATHLVNHGAELNAVKELLGHSSLAATQVYTHNSIEKLRDVHKKSHPKG